MSTEARRPRLVRRQREAQFLRARGRDAVALLDAILRQQRSLVAAANGHLPPVLIASLQTNLADAERHATALRSQIG